MNLQEYMLILSPFIFIFGSGAVVNYWAKKTRQYYWPAAFGVFSYIATIPLLVVLIAISEGSTPGQVVEDFGLAFIIVALCLVSILGILGSALVILYVSGHQM